MKILFAVLISALSLMASVKEVTVSILPQKFFVEKIAKDKINVNVMVKKGFSPATYEPKTSQMKKLSHSVAYFSIGVPFEKVWLERFSDANSKMMMVDTSKGIAKIEMAEHTHHDEEGHKDHDEHKEHGKHDDHDHDEHKEHGKNDDHDEHKEDGKHDDHDEHKEHVGHDDHHHDGLDPHIWLDPLLVKQQAKTIVEALVKLDASNKSFYKKNYQTFIKELDHLHHELHETLEGLDGSAFMVFHPSWGYFAKRYHLEQIPVEKEGKEPKPKELTHLIEEAKIHNIKVVFVAPQFSQKAAKVIAKNINANVVNLDPLAYEYMKNLEKVAQAIKKSY